MMGRAGRFVWRFVVGHHVMGDHPRTNYGFLRRGDRTAAHARTVTAWGRASMLTRATVRLVVVTGTVAGWYGWQYAHTVTVCALVTVAGSTAAFASWRIVRAGRTWRHKHTVLHPLSSAIAPLLGVSTVEASAAIELPRGYDKVTDGALGRVLLPDHFLAAPDQRAAIDHLISSRLPVDVDTTWRMSVTPMRVEIKASPKPPSMVPFTSLVDEMAACRSGEVVIGRDKRGEVFRGSFLGDDPHWGMSVGSGRGKSTFLWCTAAQILHQDPRNTVTGIDPKMTSLEPLVGIPGVRIANNPDDVEAMWALISEFRAEVRRRMEVQNADPTAEFPLALLVIDEVNMFAAMTGAHWRLTKEKGDPATPPVWMDIASCLWMGRAFRCHLILVGQRLDDRSTGNIGLRDSLGFRGLGGFTQQQWAMLIGTAPIPRSQKPKGRWIYSDGQEQTWVQNAYGTAKEIRDYALVGRRRPVSLEAAPAVSPEAHGESPTGRDESPVDIVWVVGNDAAAARLGLSESAFRKRRQRPGFLPEPTYQGRQPAWPAAVIDDWARDNSAAASTNGTDAE